MSDEFAQCRCGSGKKASVCCDQESPPITRSELRINSIQINSQAQVIDYFGRAISPPFPATIAGRLKVSDVFVIEDNVYAIFKKSVNDISRRIPPIAQTTSQLKSTEQEKFMIDNLYRNMKAVRYHHQNFIYRFNRISAEFREKPFIIKGTEMTIVDEDTPLEVEFEAFMIRYRIMVELVFKAISFKILNEPFNKPLRIDKLIESIKRRTKDKKSKLLADLFNKYEEWLNEQRSIRNKIVHDGELNALSAFEHSRGQTLEAVILDRTADDMCFELYGTLLAFVRDIMNVLYPGEEEM